MTADAIPRPKLLERLDEGLAGPATLVCAPAGSGKSTLVSSWIDRLDRPAAWITLDREDGDPVVFAHYLLAAVRSLFPGACPRTAEMVTQFGRGPEPGLLADELDELNEPFVIVLDEFSEVPGPEVHQLLGSIFKHPPRTAHFVLIVRSDPPLSLHAMRAQGQLCEVRLRDLLFERSEVAEFLRHAVGLDPDGDTLTRLLERTEGWVTGLRLLVLALRAGADLASELDQLPVGTRPLQEYLGAEVLALQPPDIQDAMLRLALLDRFDAGLCDAALGPATAGVGDAAGRGHLFDRLLAANLFLTPLDANGEWFRFQNLMRAFLRRRAQRELPADEIARVHDRVRDRLESMGLVPEAVEHALLGTDRTLVVRLIWNNRHRLLERERLAELVRLVMRIPPEIAEQDVHALLLRAWCVPPNRLPAVLDRIEPLLPGADEAGSPESLRGEYAALRAHQFYAEADAAEVVRCASAALQALPAESRAARADACFMLALGRQMAGDVEGGRAALQQGRDEHASHRDGAFGTVLAARCFFHWGEADLARLRDAAVRCLEVGRKEGLGQTQAMGCYFLALVHYQRNELEEARAVLESFERVEYGQHMSLLALVLLELGRIDEAKSLAAKLMERATSSVLATEESLRSVRALEAELALRQGRLDAAVQWVHGFQPGRLQPFHYGFEPRLTQVNVLLAEASAESLDRVARILDELDAFAVQTSNRSVRIEVLARKAMLHWVRGREDEAVAALAEALTLGRAGGFLRPFADVRPDLRPALARLEGREDLARLARRIRRAIEGSRSRLDATPVPSPTREPGPLTDRELEILELLAQRLSNKEIGSRLFISPHTVKRHTINIYGKLHVSGRRAAVAKATSLGLLPGA